jgi:hypothetical protein
MNTPVSLEIERLLLKKDIDMPVETTIADVVMMLYEKHGIWIWVKPYKDHAADNNDPYFFQMNVWKKGITISKEFNSPTEAYEAAIEYTLNNLI